jgi:hypothetical protein
MNHRKLGPLALLGLIVMLAFFLAGSFTEAAGPTGAIFTTTPDGVIVNENVRYEDKRDVYLDGGPPPNAPKTAAGLDDGLYVFQVTDPSGKFLLSEDPAKCRVVRVEDGVIVARVNPDFPGVDLITADPTFTYGNGANAKPCHVDDDPPHPTDPGVRGASGRHDTNVDFDHGDTGAIVVQLMPYGTTPNPGGVYKAWITPLDKYVEKGGELNVEPKKLPPSKQRPHSCPDFCASADAGFKHPDIKTDNFKVQEVEEFDPPEITVRKFHDLNGDGIWDEGEPEIGVDECVDAVGNLGDCADPDFGGWPYNFTEPGFPAQGFFTPNTHVAAEPGDYLVCEEILDGWFQSASRLDGVYDDPFQQCVTVPVAGTSGETHEVVFGNYMEGTKSGTKFSAETGAALEGWEIHLYGTDGLGNAVHEHATTDAGGAYTFSVPPGSYTVCEEMQLGWVQTYPTGATPGAAACEDPHDNGHGPVTLGPWGWDVTMTSGATHADNDFVNAPPQGCTPGFWKTHSSYGPATGDHWLPTGYDPDDLVSSVFASAGLPPYEHLGDASLLAGLDFQGGDSVEQKAEILLRAAIAAVLNAAHPDIAYTYSEQWVIDAVNDALDSWDPDQILALATLLDNANNEGCPIGGLTE